MGQHESCPGDLYSYLYIISRKTQKDKQMNETLFVEVSEDFIKINTHGSAEILSLTCPYGQATA